jgi:hypothetical protein
MSLPVLSSTDFINFLISYLPSGWWAPAVLTPTHLDYAVLKAIAGGDKYVFDELASVQSAVALTNATGSQVDEIVRDYYASKLPRNTGESDAAYKSRFIGRVFSKACTRAGITQILTDTLGSVPTITEKYEAGLTGGYAGGGGGNYNTYGGGAYFKAGTDEGRLGYTQAGAYAKPVLFNASQTGAIGYNVAGMYGYNKGWGLNAYEALIKVQQPEPTSPNFLTRAQIMALIEGIKPYGTNMWVAVLGPASTGGVPIG